MSAAPGIRTMPDPFTPDEIARYYKVQAPGVRQFGKEWRGPCPLHQGKRHSFAINPRTGEWFCHSECGRGGSLIDFEIELSGRTFAEAAIEARSICGRVERQRKGPIVCTYDYVDENGQMLFQCVRRQPKDFSQRRRDSHGGWIWNLEGVRRFLFRLPTLSNAELVLVAEGEKDVLNLVKLGFIATCNPMGAGKWRPEYSKQLRGKHVVILPDNDESGDRHASSVARSLARQAASVRIARVPVGKDASDWIAAGATRDDIETAIEAALIPENLNADVSPKSTDWSNRLLVSDRGSPRAVLANAITALRLAPEWNGVLGFNEFSLGTVALKEPPWHLSVAGAEWTDHEDRLTADWLQHHGIFVSVEIAGLAVQTVARDRTFHPVRQKLDSLRWDGTGRINGWLSLYLGAEPNEYTSAVGSRWLISAFRCCRTVVKPGASLYVCHSSSWQREFQNALETAGFEVRCQIIWAKNTFAWGFGRYKFQHEPIFYLHVADQKDPWYGDKSQSTLWQEKKPAANRIHPTAKPVELVERAIVNSSKAGDVVADLFGGSGSTLIGCERRNRRARLMEIDPKYADCILRRYQEYTGKQTVLEGDGRSFDEIAKERLKEAA